FFPLSGNLNAEIPSKGSIGLDDVDFASELIHRTIEGMAVNRRGACIHPQSGWNRNLPEGRTQNLCTLYSGLQNFLAMSRIIPAVHAPARQIDNNVRVVQFLHPVAEGHPVPRNGSPG